jgi:hypothetical protein
MMNAGWIVLGIGTVIAVLIVATSRYRRDHPFDLGSVSHQWINDQRNGQNDSQR